MADVRLVWDAVRQRCDWTIVNGRLAASADLESIVLLLLFTDRHAEPGYVPVDGSTNLRGVWFDTFERGLWGSRLWQLRRMKIANRTQLAATAQGMVLEALQPMVDGGLLSAVQCVVRVPPATQGQPGGTMFIYIRLVLPTAKNQDFIYNYVAGSLPPLASTIPALPAPGRILRDNSGKPILDISGNPIRDNS